MCKSRPKLITTIVICFLFLSFPFFFTSCFHRSITSNTNVTSNDTILSKKEKKDSIKKVKEKENYPVENKIIYYNYTASENIKTVLLYKEGFELSLPLIELNSSEKMLLSFDDFDYTDIIYKYTFIHCDADWTPSDMQPFEYLKGFTEDLIDDYQYSFNTIKKYTHYKLLFPTENMKLTKSGNYILKVYKDGYPDNAVLTRRFMIVEPHVTISATAKRATLIEDMDYKQEIDFTVNYANYPIANPYQDVKITITQNNRNDNAITNLKPKYINNNQLVYDFEQGNTFEGGNEFRFFDLKSIKSRTINIAKIGYDSLGYYAYILPDEKRAFKNYYFSQDINGRKLIKTDDYPDSDIEAEYVNVHFTLPYNFTVIGGNIYVLGALTDWNFTNEGMLKYNYLNHTYETSILLKQGYYNYIYVFLEDGKTAGDETLIEGTRYETENEYAIYVYCKENGTTYDKLIGVKIINSQKQN
jgi:hypothetical protein